MNPAIVGRCAYYCYRWLLMLEALRHDVLALRRPTPLHAYSLMEYRLVDAHHLNIVASSPIHIILEGLEGLLIHCMLEVVIWAAPAPPNSYLLELDSILSELPFQ